MTFSKGEMRRLNSMFGNGAVYASDGTRVFQYHAANFQAEKLNRTDALDLDVQEDEILTCFGVGTSKAGAIRALDQIKKCIEEIPDDAFNLASWDFEDESEIDVVNCWPKRRR